MYSRQTHFFLWMLILVVVFLGIWALGSPHAWGLSHGKPMKGFEAALGIAGYCFFALSLLLSSRWKKLEDWCGGLDRVYHLHRAFGIWGFCLVLIHPWIGAIRWLPQHWDRVLLLALPFHARLSINLGVIAYWLMIVILGVTLLKLLPYDKWKWLHKIMSAVFILSTLHFLLSDRRFGSAFSQGILYIPMAIGFLAIVYKQVYLAFFARRLPFRVTGTRKINDNVLEVTLSPSAALQYIPGQYGFFVFENPHITKESHPFTLIGSHNSSQTILVKARGDYTRSLYQHLASGTPATFEGPYGRLDYTKAGPSQIWIAGGIGIAPFLAWVRAMNEADRELEIDFFYCVHRRSDAVFLETFEQASRAFPRYRFFLQCTEDHERLDIQKIVDRCGSLAGKQILMCGPKKLTGYFVKQFQALGVKREAIHFEDFEFF